MALGNDAQKDRNFTSTLLGVLNTDGKSIVSVTADPVSHYLRVSDGTSGSNNGPADALKDNNNVSTLICVSSTDLKTPVAVYANSIGQLLVDSS